MIVDEGRRRLRSIVFASVWIAIAFWPARVAARKGHSFIGYFVLSLGFFPLALFLAYRAEDLSPQLADQLLQDEALEDRALEDQSLENEPSADESAKADALKATKG